MNFKEKIKLKQIEAKLFILKHLNNKMLPNKTKTWGKLDDIIKMIGVSEITIQLYKEDKDRKDYIFSVLRLLEKYGINYTLTEFDRIFLTDDIKEINSISKTARINFRYVFPNAWGGFNVSTEMGVDEYLRLLFPKIKFLVDVACYNFKSLEERILFIATQLSEYVKYDFNANEKKQEEYLKMSSLFGCLIDKETICTGVAFAFERCMTEMGLENTLVCGCAGMEDKDLNPLLHNHVWNRVKPYDSSYNVDITNILELPSCEIPQEERIKTYILSSDTTLKGVGIFITDYEGIEEANQDFQGVTELYEKMKNIKNVLEQFDQGNMSLFLQYKMPNNNDQHLKCYSSRNPSLDYRDTS